jgi:site-specific recombinase XerD
MNTLTAFQSYLVEQGRSPNTIRGYMQDMSQFSRWFEDTNGETLTGSNLTPSDIRQYRQWLQHEKRSANTINRHLATLRTFGAALVDIGQMADNPAAKITGMGHQELAPKWLDKAEQKRLEREVDLQVAGARTEAGRRQAIRDRAVVILLLNAGLRIGELCALEVDDIEISDRKGMLTVRQGKGSKERRVPLNKNAREALSIWLLCREGDAVKLFTGKRGDTLTPSGLSRRLAMIGRRSKVDLTAHTLRHSFAKNLVDLGVSLEKVAAILGHARLETTRIYTVPGEGDLMRAVEGLDW